MADEPIQMTRAEYQAKYGAIPVPAIPIDTRPIPANTTEMTIQGAETVPVVKMTRAEYAAKYGEASKPSYPTLFEDPIGALTSPDWWQTRPSGEKISVAQSVAAPALSALDALTLGGGDELASALSGMPIDKVRDIQSSFRGASPVIDTGLQIAASLKNPITLAGNISKIPGALAKGIQLAKDGALLGGLYGFGEGENGFLNRLKSGATTGVISAAAAPALGLPIMYGSEAILNKASQYAPQAKELWNRLTTSSGRRLSSQTGALNTKPGNPLPSGYSPTDLMLAKQFKNVPIEKITAGANEMATVGDTPLFLPEAMKSAKVDRNARYVANNEFSMDFAKDAIEARTAGASTRAGQALKEISPVESSFEGAKRMTGAAEKIIEKAKSNRFTISDPLYKQAYKDRPLIVDSDFKEFYSKDKFLQSAVKDVKKNFEFADLPDNHTKVLVHARSEIGDKISLSAGGAEKSRLQSTYNKLNEFLHKSGEGDSLILADATFKHATGGIDELSESFLANLSRISDNKIQNIGQIFKLPKEQISKLRETFQKSGMIGEWEAGIKAHLSESVSSTKDGRNFAKEFVGDNAMREKMQAALGGKNSKVSKALELEDRMFEGRNTYYPGSSTAGNIAEATSFRQGVGVMRRLLNKDFSGAFDALMGGDMSEEVAQGLARIYFDPKTGRQTINKIMPLLKAYKNNEVLSTALSNAATKGAPVSAYNLRKEKRAASQSTQFNKIVKQQPINAPIVQTKPIKQAVSYTPDVIKDLIKDEPPMVKAIIKIESNFNHKARSNKGALGLGQLMPENIKKLGIKDPFNPEENIKGVKALLSEELDRYKDSPILAIAAYNLGSPKMNRAIERAGSKNWAQVSRFVPLETRQYVTKFLAAIRSV